MRSHIQKRLRCVHNIIVSLNHETMVLPKKNLILALEKKKEIDLIKIKKK